MSFIKEYEVRKSEADGIISEVYEHLENVPEPLCSSIKYSLGNGGKRIRPILFLETLKIFGVPISPAAKKVAAAIECIHTYSLVHDDLPCMDDDDFRRGKPTNHKVYGEGIAVLAGDALLNFAFELLIDAIKESGGNINYVKAAQRISIFAGKDGMIAGQTLDIYSKDDIMTAEKINYIYEHKTGDLMQAAVCAGAVIADTDSTTVEALKIFAKNYGFAFQVKDDIEDYENNIKHEVKNYIDIFGIANAKKTLNERLNLALTALNAINADTSFFKKLIQKSF